MESMPFPEGSFDAAVSQFGFEYGVVDKAATELARVPAPKGSFSFLVHHSESSVVTHNRIRNRALRALCGEAAGKAFLSGSTVMLDQQLASLGRQFPDEAIVREVADALRSRLGQSDVKRAAIWNAVLNALLPEREILDAMEAACVQPAKLEAWLDRFTEKFEIAAPSTLQKPTGEVIAWKIEGVQSPD